MPVTFALSAIIKIADRFTGKPIDGVKLHAEGHDGTLLDKGDGIFALVNWSSSPLRLFAQKNGYEPLKWSIEKQDEKVLYQTITMRQKRSGISCVKCRFKTKNQNGAVLFGFLSRGASKRIVRDMEKGALTIKVSGNPDLTEEYRKILLDGEKAVYTVTGYDCMDEAYCLDHPLENAVDMGTMLCVLQEDMVKDSVFFAEYLNGTRREEKVDRIVAVFQNKFYEAKLKEDAEQTEVVFKEW